jgi:hypothetical protein
LVEEQAQIMPNKNPEVQQKLFEKLGGGPLLREDIIPEIEIENVSYTGNPSSDPPGEFPRDDQAVSIDYALQQISEKLTDVYEPLPNELLIPFSRLDYVIPTDISENTVLNSTAYDPSLDGLLVYWNGLLLQKNDSYAFGTAIDGIAETITIKYKSSADDEFTFITA